MKLSQAAIITERAINFAMDLKDGRDAQYIVPYLIGGAGLGKTTMVKDATKRVADNRKVEMECRILSLAQYDPAEIAGWLIPNEDRTAMNRIKPDWMPDPDTCGVLFLDELPQAMVANQNIAAQITNERRVGPWSLPDGWVVVAAGNRTSDRAGTNNMPSHLKDRLMFLEVEADLEDTISYFNSNHVDERVCAYLRFRPEWLHKFDKDANACPSPRSWERVSSIMSWGLPDVEQLEAIAGQVGRACSAEFAGFLKVYDVVPDIPSLIANPMSADIPDRPDVMYAVCASLAAYATDKNLGNIIKYLQRLPQAEFAAFVMKDAANRVPNIKQNKDFRDWVINGGGKELLI